MVVVEIMILCIVIRFRVFCATKTSCNVILLEKETRKFIKDYFAQVTVLEKRALLSSNSIVPEDKGRCHNRLHRIRRVWPCAVIVKSRRCAQRCASVGPAGIKIWMSTAVGNPCFRETCQETHISGTGDLVIDGRNRW
jgi:hypothetical protein